MKKKLVAKKVSYYRNKADRMLQELGRVLHSQCEVCGKPMSCLHHFWPKSMSSGLRYSLKNCIPLCAGCHLRHHSGDPTIHAAVIEYRGQEWYDELLKEKQKITKTNKQYYENVIKYLNELI